MKKSKQKRQHLIPQVYLNLWKNEEGNLNVAELDTNKVVKNYLKKSIAKFGIKNNYYSIKAGQANCIKEDADCFFSDLLKYTVEINGRRISNTMDMNRNFENIDEWIIKDENGRSINNKKVKNEIQKMKINEIEDKWNLKYENYWGEFANQLEKKIQYMANNIPIFKKDYLVNFFCSMDWRSIISNNDFNRSYYSAMKLIYTVFEQEEDQDLIEELRYNILLKKYRDFLNDNGLIYEQAQRIKKQFEFIFLVANESKFFITSDNPSFFYGERELQIGIMPISPRILLKLKRKQRIIDNLNCDDKYNIFYIDDKEVEKYNELIQKNADKYIIYINNYDK